MQLPDRTIAADVLLDPGELAAGQRP